MHRHNRTPHELDDLELELLAEVRKAFGAEGIVLIRRIGECEHGTPQRAADMHGSETLSREEMALILEQTAAGLREQIAAADEDPS